MDYQAGSAWVPVRPAFSGFHKEIAKEFGKLGPTIRALGQEFGKEFAQGLRTGMGNPISEPLKQDHEKQKKRAPAQGKEQGGAFAQSYRKAVQAALWSLPEAEIKGDATHAQKEIAGVRAQLAALADKTVGVDVDADQALGELRVVQLRLEEIDDGADPQIRADTAQASAALDALLRKVRELRGTHRVAVDADTAPAQAKLSATKQQADDLDRTRASVRVDADTHSATSGMLALSVAAAGVMAIPVGAVLSAGLISVLGPLGAVTAGFGSLALVAAPALGRIGEALKAQEAAQTATAGSTRNLAAEQAQGQVRAMQLANAQAGVARAQERAAEQHKAALDKVRDAERSLADAQRDARKAQEGVNEARAQARKDAQDLAQQLAQARLDEERATLAVVQAQNRLLEVRAAANMGRASATDVQSAELDVRQAQQGKTVSSAEVARLVAAQAAADKAGVDGSDRVREARERLADANRKVSDQETRVAEARANVTKVDRESARAVAQARQQVQMMRLQQQAATASAAGASAAATKYGAAMGALSPAARTLMGDWMAFRDQFDAWQTSLEPTVLPLFSAGLRMMGTRLAGLTPVVHGVTAGVGILLADMQRALSSDWWQEFGDRATAAVGPSTVAFGRTTGNVATGVAGMANAGLDYSPMVLGGLESGTANFAQWGQGLSQNAGFHAFMDYAIQMAPIVSAFLRELGAAFGNLLVAMAPVGALGLSVFGALLGAIGAMPPEHLRLLALAITAVAIATKGWQIAMLLLNSSMLATPIGWIVLALGALVGAAVWAYTTFDEFRAVVDGAFSGIKQFFVSMWDGGLKQGFAQIVTTIREQIMPAVMQMWTGVFQPALSAIGALVSWVFLKVLVPAFQLYVAYIANVVVPIALWLWNKILVPVFQGIAAVVMWAWNTVIKPNLAMLVGFVTGVLAPAAMWLWKKVIAPVFKGISLAVRIAWGIIKIIFASIVFVLRNTLGVAFRWLYNNVVKPIWNGIKFSIQTVWNFIRDKVFKPMDTGTGRLGEAFQKAKRVIKTSWDEIRKAARAPARFLVEKVYMGAVKPMWDKVAGIVGADKLPDVKLPSGFARGGLLPGQSSWRDGDSMLVPMRPGEGVYVSEVMRDPYERARLHALNAAAIAGVSPAAARAGLGEGFARGGIFGGSTDGIRLPAIGDLLVDLATKGASAFAGIGSWGDAIDVLVDPVKTALAGIGKTGLPGIPYMATGAVRDKVVEWLDGNATGVGGTAQVGSTKGLPSAVLAIARGAVGKFPEQPPGSNRNAITTWYGMHDQWCAMFISWLFAQANASGSLKRAKRTAWTGDYYNSGMRRVTSANRQPGDVLVYGRQHVNLATGRRSTIGGNESNNVRASASYGGSPAVFRPDWQTNTRGGYAKGGIAPRGTFTRTMMRRIGQQDDRTNPIVPAYNRGGWVRGLSGDRNLILAAKDEYVVRAKPAQQHGPLLEAINRGYQIGDILATTGAHPGLSPSQQAALADLATVRAGSSVNAELHLHDGQATVREAFRELRHEVKRMDLEGKYGR